VPTAQARGASWSKKRMAALAVFETAVKARRHV
jgi:hypothetical protein